MPVTKIKQFRDPDLDTSGEVVGFYEREFYVFSNFSSFQVEWKDRVWPTSEHAYQGAKFLVSHPEIVEEILQCGSSHMAAEIAHRNKDKYDDGFRERKVETMEDICKHKLVQHPYIQRKLLQTQDLYMVEDSPKDDVWGWGPNRDGRNELGKVWMRLREWFVANTDEETKQRLLKD